MFFKAFPIRRVAFLSLFLISSGAFARNLVVITDLEPDDRVAIQLLASHFTEQEIGLVGVTVMHSARKRLLVRRLFDQLGLQSVPIIQGTGGNSDSYPNIASSKAAREYEIEGKTILSPQELENLTTTSRTSSELQLQIATFLQSHQDVEIVMLAPPTDLVGVLEANPSLKSKIKVIHIMGGWIESADAQGNKVLRTTYNWNMDPINSAKLMRMVDIPMKLYSSHMIKPNFNGGSINASNFPKIISMMKNLGTSFSAFSESAAASRSWDNHLIDRIPPLKNVIGPFAGEQFTPADPTVIVGMLSSAFDLQGRPVAVSIDPSDLDAAKGFKVDVQTQNSSKIQLIEKVDPKVFEQVMLESLSRIPEVISKRVTKRCGELLTVGQTQSRP